MKKSNMTVAAIVLSFTFIIAEADVFAADTDIGLSMMYDWWKPAFLTFEQERNNRFPTHQSSDIDEDLLGSFMIGPMFRTTVASDWIVGAQVLFGATRNEFSHQTAVLGNQPRQWPLPLASGYFDIGESNVRRFDVDVTVEHPFHKMFSLLLGLRFTYGDGEGHSCQIPLDYKKEEYSSWNLGPSAGVGFNYEFIKGLKINIGVAALFQGGIYKNNRKYLSTYYIVPFNYESDYLCVGLDNTAKLSYLINPINLEVWIGGRYTVLPHIAVSDDRSPAFDTVYKTAWINGSVDHFGGITFGAAYKI